eukprot:9256073-Pyramimonas_sp.AAC.1
MGDRGGELRSKIGLGRDPDRGARTEEKERGTEDGGRGLESRIGSRARAEEKSNARRPEDGGET